MSEPGVTEAKSGEAPPEVSKRHNVVTLSSLGSDGARRDSMRRCAGVDADRERAIGRLAKRVQAMVEESGNPEGFGALRWTEAFLLRPIPALGGKTPNEFMETEEGQALIENSISRMQSGGYA